VPLGYAEPQGLDLTSELGVAQHVRRDAGRDVGPGAKVHKIRGARILVAEDNATNQRVAQLILESGGHHVTLVDNGEAALDALERGGYDLALFDLSMPLVSGLEALKLYRFTTPQADPGADPVGERHDRGDPRLRARGRGRVHAQAAARVAAARRDRASPRRHRAPVPPPERADDRPSLTVVETPPLDPEVLQDLVKLSADPTFVERLLRGFKGDTERLVAEIGDALAPAATTSRRTRRTR
jgi:two-component system sensor histidine kinase RpfC